ncbi:unnamed protein product [Lampetra planeri]
MSRPVNGGRTFGTHILSWTRTGQGTEKFGSLWRGERSVRTSRRNPAGLMMGVRLLLMISLLHKLSLAKECGDGFYKSQGGICCELCSAGTYKVIDCIGDKMRAVCDLCPEGSFMNRVNHEEKCAQCSSCGADEEVAHACSVAQDTVCQCMEGLKRDPGSGICLYEEHHIATTAIVLGCVLALVLSALIFSRLNRKGKWLTLKKTLEHCGITNGRDNDENEKLVAVQSNGVQGSQESGTMNLIRENEENLKAWIGVDPSHLLEHLKDYKWIPHHVYNAARERHGDECVQLILDYFFNKGEPECKILWEALYFVRKHYLQLWRWLQRQGDAMQCIRENNGNIVLLHLFTGGTKTKQNDISVPKVDVVSNKVQDHHQSETLKLIQENKDKFKQWIGADPSHLIKYFEDSLSIPYEVRQAAKNKHGEECVELILDHFFSQKETSLWGLWKALYFVRKKYGPLLSWFQKHGESVRSIREKKWELKLWIGRDCQHLLSQLMIQRNNPTRLFTRSKGIHYDEECAERVLNYFIYRGNDDCLKLLFALRAVQDTYPEVKQWLDSLVQEVKQREQWQGSENATEYLLERFNVIRRQNVKQFWMVLWALREIYPHLEDIFEQF